MFYLESSKDAPDVDIIIKIEILIQEGRTDDEVPERKVFEETEGKLVTLLKVKPSPCLHYVYKIQTWHNKFIDMSV